ncbi:hypothetical protein FS837_002824, partial [Tulasnella sp. UAMH 9824]
PAISREFTTSRPPLNLTFVTHTKHNNIERIPYYFINMTRDFIQQSHKPTGRHLRDIDVRMLLTEDIRWHYSYLQPCRAGEWFVELISLIPIHIALALDNRFLPCRDGISEQAVALELLGREVKEIIDIITLGPYEAILGSYMAARPIKVVSAMGEQSVGKSYSLNHLLDTSFAGSCMRTTEVLLSMLGCSIDYLPEAATKGVWLSLCPTEDQVIVALEFKGVQSIESTDQEDMLLVLFNVAISNLIMFRNNFALHRNVANMFTSFRASARLFDPKKNPSLFKGLLTIIVKDVVNADKEDIVEEFSSKFSQIVKEEEGHNFITVLHDNRLAVMPWDVIQSKGFYMRFSKLSKYLFKQQSTHTNAGEFLLTLKTLMAKITAQDWGAINQTLIRYRTSILQASLEQALISGQGDVGPFGELEGLKNYDTQQVLDGNDTDAIFYLGSDEDGRQEGLTRLLARLGSEPARSDVGSVKSGLQVLGMQRIAHVETWIDSNVSRFMPTDNWDIKALHRKLNELSTVLLANIQLCANMTVEPRIDASNRVLSASPKNAKIPERVGSGLDTIASTYVRLQLMYAGNLAGSMTSEVVKRLASNRSSMLVAICALQSAINVESPADFEALHFTMGDYFHVLMSVRSRSTGIITLTDARSALAQYDANSAHDTAPWVTTFMGSNSEVLICATVRFIVSSPKRLDDWGAASVSLRDTELMKASIHILWIRVLSTPAKQPAPSLSVDTSVDYPTAMRKWNMIPLMGQC